MNTNSHLKTLLKKAKDALQSKQFEVALQSVNAILALDSENTAALLLKAVATQHLNQWEESEAILRDLVQAQPNLVQAWQGLEKIYEATGKKNQLPYVLEKLKTIFESLKESHRYVDTLNKLIQLYSDFYDYDKMIETWKLFLPEAPFYSLISDPPSAGSVWKQICKHQKQWDQYEIQVAESKPRKLALGSIDTNPRESLLRELALSSPLPSYYRAWLACEPSAGIFDIYLAEMMTQCNYLSPKSPVRRQILDELEEWVHRSETHRFPLGFTAYKVYLDTRNTDYSRESPCAAAITLIRDTFKNTKPCPDLQDYILALELLHLLPTSPTDLPSTLLVTDRIQTYGLFPLVVGCLTLAPLIGANQILLDHALARAWILLQETEALFDVDLHLVRIALRKRQIQLLLARQEPELALHWIQHETWSPSTPPIQLRGETFLQLHQYESAKKDFSTLDEDPWAQSCLAWCLYQTSQPNDAYALLKNISEAEIPCQHVPEHTYRMGRVYLTRQAWDKALGLLVKVVQSPLVSITLSSQAFYYLGDLYFQRKDFQRCIKCWKKSLELDASFEEVVERLSRCLLDQAQPQVALEILEKVASHYPQCAWFQKRIAFLYLDFNRPEPAWPYFLVALRIQPDQDVTLYHGLAKTYMDLGKFGAAFKTMQQAHQFFQDPLTLHLLAQSHLKMGQFEEARKRMLEAGFDLLPNVLFAGELYLLYARACLRMGRYGACAEFLNEGLTVLDTALGQLTETGKTNDQLRFWMHLRKADLMFMYTFVPHHYPSDLRAMLETTLQLYLDADRFVAAGRTAHALFLWTQEQNYLNSAFESFRMALQETPGPEVWSALGLLYLLMDQPLLAQHSFIASLHAEPKDPRTWIQYGVMCLKKQDTLLAERCFRQATLLDPDQVYAWFGLALADKEMSAEHFQHAFTITPWLDPYGYAMYLRHPPTEKPIDLAVVTSQALAWNPKDAVLWNRLGCFYEQSGNTKDACTAFQTSLKLHRDPKVIRNLARVLISTDPVQAEALFERLNTGDVWHALAKLNPEPSFLDACLSRLGTHPDAESVENASPPYVSMGDTEMYLPDVEEKTLMAQICYRANHFTPVPNLFQEAPASLCAFGMIQGNEQWIHEAFPHLPASEAHYLRSVYHILRGDSVQLALSALQRGVRMAPADVKGWRRLVHFLGRYVPTLLTSLRLPFPETYAMQSLGWLAQGDPRALGSIQKHVWLNPSKEKAWSLLHLVRPSVRMFPTLAPTYTHIQASHAFLLEENVPKALEYAQMAMQQTQPGSQSLCSLQFARVLTALPREEVPVETLVAAYKQACMSFPLAWLELLRLYLHLRWRPAARALVYFLLTHETSTQVSVGARVYHCLLDPATSTPLLESLDSPMVPVLHAMVLKAQGFSHRAAKVLKGMTVDLPEWLEHLLFTNSS